MATGNVPLGIGAATLPDDSTGNLAPGVRPVKSSAAAPSPYFLQMLFDGATRDEQCQWAFRMPDDYASGPVLKCQYKMASATTGAIILAGRIAAVTPGDSTDVDAKAFGTVNNSAADTVPGTAGFMKEVSITLTNADSLAAGDFVIVWFSRLQSNGSDTASGDLELVACSLSYTTT